MIAGDESAVSTWGWGIMAATALAAMMAGWSGWSEAK
jgi:hypothetical protein